MPAKPKSGQPKSEQVFGQARKPAKMLQVGLYARVSTLDQQTLPMQIRALREYAGKLDWVVAAQIKEVGSGAPARQLRQQLIDAARWRDIDIVLVWRLDRWGQSAADLVATLQELTELGVGFVSLTEALDLTTPTDRAMAGLLAVFALSSSARFCVSACGPGWLMRGSKVRALAGHRWWLLTELRCGSCSVRASANLRSPAACASAAPRCAVSWWYIPLRDMPPAQIYAAG